MASGFGFMGGKMVGELSVTEQVVANIANWINISFLESGAFDTIKLSDAGTDGEEKSRLVSVEDRIYGEGYVYQSAYKNWAHESGIAFNDDFGEYIVCSGIYIGGDFYHKSESGVLAYHIDYPNGRIIFDNQNSVADAYGSGDLDIYAEFSYKRVTIITADEYYRRTYIGRQANNPVGSGSAIPKDIDIKLPAVIIDSSNDSWAPYQLGGHKRGIHNVVANVYGVVKSDINRIVDILSQQQDKKIPSIDWSKSEEELDEYGDINPAYSGAYTAQAIYPWKHLYILRSTGQKMRGQALHGSAAFLIESLYHI